MKAKSAISKIKKRLGVDVSKEVAAIVNGTSSSCKVVIPWKGRVLSFYVDPARARRNADAVISLVHVRRENDHSDLQTDYHAGSFYDNLTQALDSIEPPAPKFTPGDFVRVKSTKRAARWRIDGLSGLVLEVNSHNVKLLRSDNGWSSWIRNNDVELVASAA